MFNAVYRKYYYLIVLFLIIGISESDAQRWKLLRYQVGGGFGTTQIFGDIGGAATENNLYGLKDISFTETKMSYGLNAGYKINSLFSVKANLLYGRGEGTDAGSRNDRGRSYKANFFEFSAQYEYYFLSEDPRHKSAAMFNRKGMINNYSTLSAYAFLGLGINYSLLKHNVGTSLMDFDDYRESNIAPVVLVGVGAKYLLDERWYIGAELGYRWAMNDYIDGYAQTEASKFNDVYYFLMFTANYRIKTTRRNLPTFMDRKYKKYGY